MNQELYQVLEIESRHNLNSYSTYSLVGKEDTKHISSKWHVIHAMAGQHAGEYRQGGRHRGIISARTRMLSSTCEVLAMGSRVVAFGLRACGLMFGESVSGVLSSWYWGWKAVVTSGGREVTSEMCDRVTVILNLVPSRDFQILFPSFNFMYEWFKLEFSIWNLEERMYLCWELRKKRCIRKKQKKSEKPILSFPMRVPSEVKWELHIGKRVTPLEGMMGKLKMLYLSNLRRVSWLNFQEAGTGVGVASTHMVNHLVLIARGGAPSQAAWQHLLVLIKFTIIPFKLR